MRSHRALLGLVGRGALAAAAACGADDRPPATVEPPADVVFSSDGRARLEVPRGALPAGVAVDDLTVVPLEVEGAGAGGDASLLGMFVLQPAGIVFERPVRLALTLDSLPADALALGILVDEAGAEAIPATLSGDEGGGEVVAEITHFSSVYFVLVRTGPVVFPGRTRLEIPVGGQFEVAPTIGLVGEREDVPAEVRIPWALTFRGSGLIGPTTLSGEDVIEATYRVSVANVATPISARFTALGSVAALGPAEFEGDFHPGDARPLTSEFTCSTAGRGDVLLEVEARLTISAFALHEPFSGPPLPVLEDVEWPVRRDVVYAVACVAPPAEATASTAASGDRVIVDVLVLGGHDYPLSQFQVALPDRCDARHYHAERAVPLTEGPVLPDPAPGACGYGKVGEVQTRTVTVPYEVYERYRAALQR